MQDFIASTGVGSLRHVSDESGDLWARYDIASQPAWVFINDDGAFTRSIGALGEDGLAREVQTLLSS